jgi:hypothetical protein
VFGGLFADSQNIRCSADQGSSASLKEPNTTGMLKDTVKQLVQKHIQAQQTDFSAGSKSTAVLDGANTPRDQPYT